MTMIALDKKEDRTIRALILIFLVLAAGIILAGYLYYTAYEKRLRYEVERQLFSIADLKAAELYDWRKERLGDANVLFRNDVFSRLVSRYLESPGDREVNRNLRSWLGKYQAYYQYDRIMLLDTRYAKRLVVPDKPERDNSFVSPSSSRILKSGKIAFEDFYWNEHNQRLYLKILVPIFEGNGSSRMIAVLAFRIDPNTYLYPFIKSWPTVSETAETLLVRREGNEVVFLNETKSQKEAALRLRLPLERMNVPVVKAVLGREGIVEGLNYRDGPVIAALRTVPDSPWCLSVQMDISEVHAPLKERLFLTMVLVGTLLISAGASVGLVWRHQRARHYREKYRMSEALRASEEIYRRLVETAKEAIYVAQDGMLKFVNRMTVEITGYSEQELTSTPFSEIIHPDDRDIAVGRHLRRIKGEAVPDRNQCRIIARDGSIKWAEISGVLIEWEGKPATLNVLTDITERKRAEEALRQSEENFRRSLDESPLGVRIVTMEGETLYANRAILDIYGYDSVEELINTPVKKRYTPESYLEFQTRREQRRNGFEDPSEYVVSIIRKDGSIRHLQVYRKEILWNDKRQYQVLYRDITERKRAEEKLRKASLYARSSIEASLDPLVTISTDGKILDVNMATEEITGISREKLIGRDFSDYFTEPDRAREGYEQVFRQGSVRDYPLVIRHSSGHTTDVIYNASVYKNETGEVQGVFAAARDITERKRAEEALRESEEQFRLLAEQSLMAIGIIQGGVFKYFNEAFEEINGYSADEIKRWKSLEFSKTIHPDDRNFVVDQIRKKQTGRPDVVPHYFFRIIRKNGDIRWIEIYSKTVTYKKKPADLVTLIDVTERKKAEEALRKSEECYRTLIETTRDLIYTTDRKGSITYMNRALEKILGYTPHELNGKSFAEILAPEFVDKARDIFRRAMKGELIPVYEAEMIRKDGTKIFLEFNVETLYDEKGKPAGRSGVGRDITERKRTEDELKQSYQQLRAFAERLQQIREESQVTIAREIHDELGGGLTGLKMDLSLLSQKIEGEKEGKDHDFLMKRIHSSNQLIDRLIQNVRHIGMKLRPSVLDDLGLIAALEWESEEFTNRTGIKCEFVPAFEYVNLEETTATAVFRIFQEALTNVARHSGADQVTVLFREDGGYLYLEVMDNGRGITEGEILNMKSLGILGMKERALVFGGELSISSEPGGGTTVVLKIPRKETA